jgi:hypothetical protein
VGAASAISTPGEEMGSERRMTIGAVEPATDTQAIDTPGSQPPADHVAESLEPHQPTSSAVSQPTLSSTA